MHDKMKVFVPSITHPRPDSNCKSSLDSSVALLQSGGRTTSNLASVPARLGPLTGEIKAFPFKVLDTSFLLPLNLCAPLRSFDQAGLLFLTRRRCKAEMDGRNCGTRSTIRYWKIRMDAATILCRIANAIRACN